MIKVVLSPGEQLVVYARKHNLSNQQLADMFDVKVRTIRQWKIDRGKSKPELPYEQYPCHVLCYIVRRRLGLSLRSLGKILGVSRQTLLRWENGIGDYSKLVEYLEEKGWDVRFNS